MASLVTMDTTAPRAAEFAQGLSMIRQGQAILKGYQGMANQLIAVSPAKFGGEFGVTNTSEAQALYDRLNAYNAAGSGDLIDATIDGVGN